MATEDSIPAAVAIVTKIRLQSEECFMVPAHKEGLEILDKPVTISLTMIRHVILTWIIILKFGLMPLDREGMWLNTELSEYLEFKTLSS